MPTMMPTAPTPSPTSELYFFEANTVLLSCLGSALTLIIFGGVMYFYYIHKPHREEQKKRRVFEQSEEEDEEVGGSPGPGGQRRIPVTRKHDISVRVDTLGSSSSSSSFPDLKNETRAPNKPEKPPKPSKTNSHELTTYFGNFSDVYSDKISSPRPMSGGKSLDDQPLPAPPNTIGQSYTALLRRKNEPSFSASKKAQPRITSIPKNYPEISVPVRMQDNPLQSEKSPDKNSKPPPKSPPKPPKFPLVLDNLLEITTVPAGIQDNESESGGIGGGIGGGIRGGRETGDYRADEPAREFHRHPPRGDCAAAADGDLPVGQPLRVPLRQPRLHAAHREQALPGPAVPGNQEGGFQGCDEYFQVLQSPVYLACRRTHIIHRPK